MKPKLGFFSLLAVACLVCGAGCETLVSFTEGSARDWPYVQSVGGMALGVPRRDLRGHVLLPIHCDVSGTQAITVPPTALSSALVCLPPAVRIRPGRVLLTLRTALAGSDSFDAECPTVDLGRLPAGRYAVLYRNPDGHEHSLGSIRIR